MSRVASSASGSADALHTLFRRSRTRRRKGGTRGRARSPVAMALWAVVRFLLGLLLFATALGVAVWAGYEHSPEILRQLDRWLGSRV